MHFLILIKPSFAAYLAHSKHMLKLQSICCVVNKSQEGVGKGRTGVGGGGETVSTDNAHAKASE